jgi:uncharacterized protein YndB with AHSA1/START domain
MDTQPITVSILVKAPLKKVWEFWNGPEHITKWAFASNDWEAPAAHNDVRVGGTFGTTMAAKDGSAKFDFVGTYTSVEEGKLLEYTMGDGRKVKVEFTEGPEGVQITETFDPELENTIEKQREGWQAILENFKKYTEASM